VPGTNQTCSGSSSGPERASCASSRHGTRALSGHRAPEAFAAFARALTADPVFVEAAVSEGFGLKYLLKTADYELRQWADVEFVPSRVLGPVMETGQARRHERATDLREQRRARQHLDVGEAA
jgi:hypothetical protein